MYSKSLDDDKGTTLTYVHTNKARNILNEIKSKFDVIEIENNRSSVVGGVKKNKFRFQVIESNFLRIIVY